jgi:hypothetical protein
VDATSFLTTGVTSSDPQLGSAQLNIPWNIYLASFTSKGNRKPCICSAHFRPCLKYPYHAYARLANSSTLSASPLLDISRNIYRTVNVLSSISSTEADWSSLFYFSRIAESLIINFIMSPAECYLIRGALMVLYAFYVLRMKLSFLGSIRLLAPFCNSFLDTRV